MNEDEEDVLRVWCIELCRRGFPVTDDDLMDQVQKIVIADGRETPFRDGRIAVRKTKNDQVQKSLKRKRVN